MAVYGVPYISAAGRITLPHHVGVAAVGAEGPYFFGEVELRIVVITDDRIVFKSSFNPDSDINDIVDKRNFKGVHNLLKEIESLSSRSDQQLFVADLAFVGGDKPLLFIHPLNGLPEGKIDARSIQTSKKLFDELDAAIGSKVRLLDFQQITAKALRPLLVDVDIPLLQEIRVEELDHFIKIMLCLTARPVFLRKADRIGEVHLAIVPHSPCRDFFAVNDENG